MIISRTTPGSGGEDFVFSLCFLAAPEDTIVMVEALEPFEHHLPDCSGMRYARSRFSARVRMVAHAGGPKSPSEFVINTPSGSFEDLQFGVRGSLLLAGVREADGEWFMTNFVYVTTPEFGEFSRELDPGGTIDIPETWGGGHGTHQSDAR